MKKVKIERYIYRIRHRLIVVTVQSILSVVLAMGISAQSGGIIVLNSLMPATQVATATYQVILQPGFHAVGANGNFVANIGLHNNLSPIITPAPGSNVIPLSPSLDQNFVKTITSMDSVNYATMSTIQYFDGLGRPSQTVQMGITPSGADLISRVEYDGLERPWQKYLPVPMNGNFGQYVDPATITYSDTRSYTETLYEPSSLNRLSQQKGPGVDWGNASTKVDYQTNDGTIFKFSVSSSNQLTKTGNYNANTLYKTITTDEDGNTTTEYKNMLGQVVLKRNSDNGDTYYVYDDFGQLSYVLPPGFVDGMGSTTLFGDNDLLVKQFAYLYKYDGRGNNIEKRLPGCESIYMLYDARNLLTVSQDGNQRLKSTWTIIKRDGFGRELYTGILNCDIDQSFRNVLQTDGILENYVGGTGYLGTGYSCTYYKDKIALLTVNYYDDYQFMKTLKLVIDTTQLTYDKTKESGSSYRCPRSKGLLTGTRTYLLDGSGVFQASVLYYKYNGQVIQSHSTNHLGGYDIMYNYYDFMGKPTSTLKTHGINTAYDTYKEKYAYTYDNGQRPLVTTYNLNGGNTDIILESNAYDELGRLQKKGIGNGIDVTSYSYNIRNWTTGITGSRFTENLYYNTNTLNLPNFKACYNGNIAGMQWSIPSENLGYNRTYTFNYDMLNRLTDANYYGFNGSLVSGTSGKYDEHFVLDDMGKINTLKRNENGTLINNLSFTYSGNQMVKVDNSLSPFIPYASEAFNEPVKKDSDPTIEYTFDKNGSMTSDFNSSISTINYNVLNLPDIIQFTAGHKNLYTYDASGKKLEETTYTMININTPINVSVGDISILPDPSYYTKLTTDYVGNMIYENGALKEILLPDGYYQGGVYYYYLKDHLGDNRVVINSSGAIMEKSHYYPSGMRFAPESTSNSAALPYRYNGKELETMNGLNQYDYGARRRGAGLPVWTCVDPLAEKYYSISPYAYCAGNPVRYVDIKGKYIDIYYTDENGDQQVWRFTGKNKKSPTNAFVKSFLTAYFYDVKNGDKAKNGGGANLKEAAQSTKFGVRVIQTDGASKNSVMDVGGPQNLNFVKWNPKAGLETTEKHRESPATVLEHEFGHGVREAKSSDLHQYNLDTARGSDKQYDTKDDRRIETGTEANTARANGEFPKNYMRTNHDGKLIVTPSPISNVKISYLNTDEDE